MLQKEDGLIDWSKSALDIYNQVRALDPWPGTYTHYDGQVLKIWECVVDSDSSADANSVHGQVLEAGKHLLVKCGDGALKVTALQGQGSKRMSAADYLRGRSIPAGVIFAIPCHIS
jgi:methionyl-tRNA formyltransferase